MNKRAEQHFKDEYGEHIMESVKGNTMFHKRTLKEIYSTPSDPKLHTVGLYYAISQLPKRPGVNRKGNDWSCNEVIDGFDFMFKRLQKVWNGRIQSAKNKNIPYDENAFYGIVIPKYCPVLEIKLDIMGRDIKDGGGNNAPSIDKIIPRKGYVKGNIQIISFQANRMLNDIGNYPEVALPFIKYLVKEFNVNIDDLRA